MKKATLLGAVLGLAPMAVMAADLPVAVPAPMAPPVIVQFNQWGGFYGGISFGWHSGASRANIFLPQAREGEAGFVGDTFRGEGFLAAEDRFEFQSFNCASATFGCTFTDANFALPDVGFGEHRRVDRDGLLGSLNIGYNWQLGTFVLGVEGDLTVLNNRSRSSFFGSGSADYQFDYPQVTFTDPVTGETSNVQDQRRVEGLYNIDASLATSASLNWLSTARLRAGYAAGPFLLYATGGLAFGGLQMKAGGIVEETFTETERVGTPLGAPTTTFIADSTTVWRGSRSSNGELGWTIGGGAEWQVGRGFSLKAEYLYYDLGDQTLVVNGTTTTTTGAPGQTVTTTSVAAPIRLRQNLDGHIFRVGLNFGFPVPPRPAAPVVAAY